MTRPLWHPGGPAQGCTRTRTPAPRFARRWAAAARHAAPRAPPLLPALTVSRSVECDGKLGNRVLLCHNVIVAHHSAGGGAWSVGSGEEEPVSTRHSSQRRTAAPQWPRQRQHTGTRSVVRGSESARGAAWRRSAPTKALPCSFVHRCAPATGPTHSFIRSCSRRLLGLDMVPVRGLGWRGAPGELCPGCLRAETHGPGRQANRGNRGCTELAATAAGGAQEEQWAAAQRRASGRSKTRGSRGQGTQTPAQHARGAPAPRA